MSVVIGRGEESNYTPAEYQELVAAYMKKRGASSLSNKQRRFIDRQAKRIEKLYTKSLHQSGCNTVERLQNKIIDMEQRNKRLCSDITDSDDYISRLETENMQLRQHLANIVGVALRHSQRIDQLRRVICSLSTVQPPAARPQFPPVLDERRLSYIEQALPDFCARHAGDIINGRTSGDASSNYRLPLPRILPSTPTPPPPLAEPHREINIASSATTMATNAAAATTTTTISLSLEQCVRTDDESCDSSSAAGSQVVLPDFAEIDRLPLFALCATTACIDQNWDFLDTVAEPLV